MQVAFPADYFRPIYANKNGAFEVSIKEIYSYENQELNDDFIKEKLGFETKEKLFVINFKSVINYANCCGWECLLVSQISFVLLL